MAPATRRDLRSLAGGGSGNQNGQNAASQLAQQDIEAMLETFELFKRKHINQNRDIIKTNALNQLRIRELEAKVQSLEAERALQALESVALRAHTSRLEHALVSVRRGADVILRALQPSGAGAQTHAGVFDGLGAAAVKREAGGASATVTSMLGQAPFRGRLDGRSFSSPAELSSATESKRSPAMGLGVGLGMGAGSTMGAGNALGIGIHLDSEGHGWPLEPHELPGARIVLDPAALPTGVSKPVARAPEAHLGNVDEADELLPETDTETEQDQRWDAHDFMDEQGETYSTEPGAQQERELYLAPGSARRSSGRRRATPRREATPLTWSTETFSSRTSGFNAEGPPSPVSSPEPTFVPPGSAFGASDFEQQPDRSRTAEPLREPQTPNEASGRTARRASRRQSGLLSIPMLDGSAEDAQAGPSRARDQVEAVEPTESSSNAVHLREVSGDSDSAQNEAVPASAPFTAQALALRDVTNARADATPYSPVKGRKGKIPLRGVASDPNMRSGIDSGVAVFEAVTPGGRKRKVPSPSGPDEATMLFSPALSSTSASTSNMEDAEGVGGRSRRARKSVNYALPKLNTKMRKPDPVELVPAQAGAPSTDSSRNATPTIARLCASTGSLSDIRRQHEAAAQTLLGGWTGERGSTEDQGRRNGVDDEDGNAEGGSASLADLFETNPRAGVSHRAWPTSLTSPSAMSAVLHENVANSDTSDDEGGLAELAELGTVTTDEGEGGLSDARTDADLDAMLSDEDSAGRAGNGKPAAKSRPEIATKETQAQGDAKSSPSKKSGPTPTLRRRSMTLPSRPIALNRTSPSENAGGNGAAERTSSSGLMPAANVRSPAFGAAASKTPLSLTTASASKTTAHTASNRRRSLSTNGASRAPGLNNSSASAGMRAKDRPASAGVGAASSSSSSNSNSSSSLPERPRTYSGASSASMATAALGVGSGANSLGRASANHRISLHSALTDPPPVPDVPGSLTRTLVPPSGNTPPRSKASPAGSNSSAPGSKNAQTPASLGITGKASPALSNASHSSRATGGASSDGSTPGNARPRVQVRQVQSSSSLPGNATARTDSQGPTASSAPASEGRRMSRRLSAVPPS